MRYLQYKGLIEREYKKSLKRVMYGICAEKELNASEGAKELGVAKEIFVYWRHYYRLEKKQLKFDRIVQDLDDFQEIYAQGIKTINLKNIKELEDEESIQDLEEVIVHLIDYYKYMHYKKTGIVHESVKLPIAEFGHSVVENYRKGNYSEEAASSNKQIWH